jgi:hypothetical protein
VIACGEQLALPLAVRTGVRVEAIPKREADAIIRAGHYSGSVVWSSCLHLGVYAGARLIGALQFGPGMNPASGSKVVRDTPKGGWLELNRMWLDDDKPPNTATQAISQALALIRRTRPHVQWVQSFADERCGKRGGVYQAASFLYLGSHTTTFYLLDGEWFHKSLLGRAPVDKRGWGSGPKAARFAAGRDRAVPHVFEQYRYLKPLRRDVVRRLTMPVQPYPKGTKGEP